MPLERAALAELPSLNPDRVELALAFPEHFAAALEPPILVTQVTADRNRPNIEELGEYAPTALAQGYVVMTAQGVPWPRSPDADTLMHRYVALRAALRWLAREVPRSERWPIVLAVFRAAPKSARHWPSA